MRPDFLKTLWMLRFEKIRDAEEEAAFKYQQLMDSIILLLGKDHETVKLLKRMVKDELNHGVIARELIEICDRNQPEIKVVEH